MVFRPPLIIKDCKSQIIGQDIKMAKILFLFSLLVLMVLIKHSQGALFYFYKLNPTQVPIPPLDKV